MTDSIPPECGGAETIAPWQGLGACTVPGIHEHRLTGLGFNAAAPDTVLIRLLEHKGRVLGFLWRANLPPSVVNAAIEHPRWEVRCHLLEDHQINSLSTPQWIGLLDGPTAEQRRRALIVMLCAESRARLPRVLIDRLIRDPAASVRASAAALQGVNAAHLAALAVDSEPQVRAAAVPYAFAEIDADARSALLNDPDPHVRSAALLRLYQDEPMPAGTLDELLGSAGSIAHNCALTPESFRRLADGDIGTGTGTGTGTGQRLALAENPRLTADQVGELAADPDPWVRLRVSTRPELTEQQRAAIPLEIDSRTGSSTLPWVAALHDDAEAMRRLARSAHPFIRRSVARAAHLPPDVVARLARDPDRAVHLFLAESCDDATPEVLLSVASWWSGSLSHPDRPRSHPNFPREGLLRFADDPNPLLRRLALDDPASDAALAERFADDPEDVVRERAAADPRLSAGTLERLLEDPGTRWRAARNPSLPIARLVELLGSERSARDAAANPRIPEAVMHHMIDAAEPHIGPGDRAA